MARPLLVNPSTKTLQISLNSAPLGAVTLTVTRKGHRHHHATGTFGPRDKCGLPSARVFDHCPPVHGCDNGHSSLTMHCAGRVDVNECVSECTRSYGGGCSNGCGRGCEGGCHHEHHHKEPSVTYTATMDGCKATFTLDEGVLDAPNGYYTADLFDGKAHVKKFTMVVSGTSLRANVTPTSGGC